MNPPQSVRSRRPYRNAALLMATLLAACGGGGGDSPTAVSPNPSAPTPIAAYTVSGAVTVTETSAIDSDTNDPNQPDRKDNGTFEGAQSLPNPVQAVGYLTMPGGAPEGAVSVAGDLVDGYRLFLEAGQVVELEFAADPQRFDIDLFIYDASRQPVGPPVGVSDGVNQYECVRISQRGEYFVGALVFTPTSSGGSVYQLRIAAPGSGTTCANATSTSAGVIANRIIATRAPTPAAVAAKSDPGALTQMTVLSGDPESGRPHLVALAAGRSARAAAVDRLAAAARELKGISGTGALSSASGESGARVASQLAGWRQALSPEALAVHETIEQAKLMVASGAYSSAIPDHRVSVRQTRALTPLPPNDREYVKQRWHYEAINLPSAVAAVQGIDLSASPAPIVAVVDTGIVADHPDLANHLVPGFDMIGDAAQAGDGGGADANPDDASTAPGSSFHGTHVAGTVAAEAYNGIGGIGVAPIARIMPVRVLGIAGSGSLYDILQGIRFAAGLPTDSGAAPARRADVINLSLGAEGLACEATLQTLFNEVRARGSVVVAAAGNESTASQLAPVGFPANCETVFSVAATDARNQRAPYSNVGPQNFLAAPGGDTSQSTTGSGLPDGIYSTTANLAGTTRTPTYGFLQGTSMATPHAAGVFALMRWVNPALTVAAIESLVSSGSIVDDLGSAGRDTFFGFGLINARKAVDAAIASRGGTPPPPTAGRTEAQPSSISLGAIRTEADLVLAHVGASNERVVSVTTDSLAITVGPKQAGAVDPATGLGTYRVLANRNAIAVGASVFPNVVIRLSPERTITVPVALSRPSAGAGRGTMGPVYVLVVNADDSDRPVVAQATIGAPVDGVYRYSVAVPGTPGISIIAGNDVDNDAFICGAGEACGAFPTLSSELQVIRPTGNLTDVDFSLWPFGGVRPDAAVKSR